jgi:hypothetical protein
VALAPPAAASAITIQNRAVPLPVVVRDAKTMFATFFVAAAPARRLFPQTGIRLAEVVPGRTLVSIAAVEHRDGDLGPYNEISVAFPVRIGHGASWPFVGMALDFSAGRAGVYIHQLPVTTAFSCAAGREIWGLPKFLADIDFADAADRRTAVLRVDGVHALTLSVKRGGRSSFGDALLHALAIRDGRIWKTPFEASGEGFGLSLRGATLELGEHAIAQELRTLGLPKRPLLSGWIERMSARFQPPTLLDA